MTIIAGTGHRYVALAGNHLWSCTHKALVEALSIQYKKEEHDDELLLLSGMAQGWDMAVARFALDNNIPFHAYVSYLGQDYMWPLDIRKEYEELIKNANKVVVATDKYPTTYKEAAASNYKRDRLLVMDSDKLWALQRPGIIKGGTAYTVKYAKSKQKDVLNLWDTFVAVSADRNLPLIP